LSRELFWLLKIKIKNNNNSMSNPFEEVNHSTVLSQEIYCFALKNKKTTQHNNSTSLSPTIETWWSFPIHYSTPESVFTIKFKLQNYSHFSTLFIYLHLFKPFSKISFHINLYLFSQLSPTVQPASPLPTSARRSPHKPKN
jgi:hypothetical protein